MFLPIARFDDRDGFCLSSMQRLAVYCGSRNVDPSGYTRATADLGRLLVQHGFSLVYGGARVGLMGVIADSVLAAGGEVIGVIPRALMDEDVTHPGLSRLEVVDSMHERKARMIELSNGLIALPGGLGTLEELFEALTWAQLKFHRKPVGLLNVDGYFHQLLCFLDTAVQQGFVSETHRKLLMDAVDPAQLLNQMVAAL